MAQVAQVASGSKEKEMLSQKPPEHTPPALFQPYRVVGQTNVFSFFSDWFWNSPMNQNG